MTIKTIPNVTERNKLHVVIVTALVCAWVVSIIDRAAAFNSLPYIFIIYGFFIIKKHGIDDNIESIFYPLLLLFTYQVFVNTINSASLTVHLDQIKTNIRSILLLPVFMALTNKELLNQKYVKYFAFITLIYVMAEGYFQIIFGQTILFESKLLAGGKVTSVFSNPNPFGLCMFLLCATSLSFIDRKMLLSTLLFVMSFYILLISGSRAALLSTVIYTLFYLLKTDYRKALAVSACIIFFIIFENNFIESFKSILIAEDSGRFDIWKTVLAHVINQPIFGHGYDYFNRSEMLPIYVSPHNSILEIVLSYGFVGVFIYIYLFYKIAIDLLKSKKIHYLILIFSTLLITLFDYSLTTGKLFLAILTILIYISLSDKNEY